MTLQQASTGILALVDICVSETESILMTPAGSILVARIFMLPVTRNYQVG